MKSLSFKIVLFFSFFQLIGCSYAYYRPTVMNIPNFKEKNEVLFAVNANTTSQSTGVDVQAAYAITNHLVVQGNYMSISDDVKTWGFLSGSYDIKRSFSCGEYAAGYFTPINQTGTFSIVGGYGFGKMENVINQGKYSADFNKMFIQSSFGLREENIELVGSLKLSTLNYTNINHIEDSYGNEIYNALNSTTPILEGGGILRFGGKGVKLQLQATTATSLVSKPSFEYDWLTLSAGICVQVGTKRKSK
jgi:cell division protein YceG involved in septum cleavage